jgi:hypothetical protein
VPDEFRVIHIAINDEQWYHLLQLWISDPHSYDAQTSLERELRELERWQLVRFKNQNERWNRLPNQPFLLRDHVELTEVGGRFLAWRRTIPPTTSCGDPKPQHLLASEVIEASGFATCRFGAGSVALPARGKRAQRGAAGDVRRSAGRLMLIRGARLAGRGIEGARKVPTGGYHQM